MKHQKIKEALKSLKPKRSIWGFLGVLLFFILPEIIAFFYAQDIVVFAQNALSNTDDFAWQSLYKMLIFSFEDGVSYANLSIGVALLIWLFF